MSNNELIIAMDGPSGSGKTSVGREVARRFRLSFMDTGAMYRALTWAGLELGVDPGKEEELVFLADRVHIILGTSVEDESVAVRYDDKERNVSSDIRQSYISQTVSLVASHMAVRAVLVRRQRELIDQLGRQVVVDGRDIATVVAPQAQVRLVLTANQKVRLRRRGLQLSQEGVHVDERQIRKQVVARDVKDSQVTQFMDAGAGGFVVDSSELSFEQTVSKVVDIVCRSVPWAKSRLDER